MRHFAMIALACATALASACGSSIPPPNDEWAAAQADVGRAQAGGAPSVPDAKLHLQFAIEDLARSKKLIGEDNARAASLTAAARAEAQLALSIAQAAAAEDRASSAQEELQKAQSAGH